MAGRSEDEFSNVACITVTESAANTLTYKKLEAGISITDKVAWLISRIEYHTLTSLAGAFNADGAQLHVGMSVYNGLTTQQSVGSIADPSMIDRVWLEEVYFGAAASGFLFQRPLIHDFSDLPGGGIIVPPTPIYGWAQGNALTVATDTVIRFHYTLLKLGTEQYWQLVEARRVIAS